MTQSLAIWDRYKPISLSCMLALCLVGCQTSKSPTSPWQPDLGNGFYQNPIIHADYSDPDAIRVGNRYYMISSSFNSSPGLPLLQSDDMVNWSLVGYALPQQIPRKVFEVPQHGKGVWAPCLRHHDNKFWIFYPDPDFGIYVMTAENFSGPWSEPRLLLAGKGLIDPTPLWDDDGNAYLLHAWAKSRAGINNLLTLRRMSPDAKAILDPEGKIIIDANKLPGYRTLEGPKFYKRNGYYYVFAPAGGVEFGWQSVFRAKNIEGPYDDKIVLEQGLSPINGPHQGAWVQAEDGSDWFFHFQDKRAYGRIVHLQPMDWENDWPVMGIDADGDGIGEPVLTYRKRVPGKFPIANPALLDEFNNRVLGVQWQWNANWKPEWYSLGERPDHLRLFARVDSHYQTQQHLWNVPSLLLQKLPAEEFVVDTAIDVRNMRPGDATGLLIYGLRYQWIGIKHHAHGKELELAFCGNTETNCTEQIVTSLPFNGDQIFLRMTLTKGAQVQFAFSGDNHQFTPIGPNFAASEGRWVGARMGLFALSTAGTNTPDTSFVDVDYFRVSPISN